jgi:hypothetical protein
LKKKYSGKLATVKELFPDWTDEDIVYALQETDGDLEGTVERITEGTCPIAMCHTCQATDDQVSLACRPIERSEVDH